MKAEYIENYRRLGYRIAYFRKIREMTQEQLAEKIGKNAAYIGQIEATNVHVAISMDMLFDLSRALDVPASKLLEFDDFEVTAKTGG